MDEMETDMMHGTAKPLGVQYDFYLDFPIQEPEAFYDFFHVLREASPDDLVILHINSPGGHVDTCIQIINAINRTHATVIASAEGDVASSAAFIFFSCHGMQIGDHTSFLLHNGMGGAMGKPNDNLATVQAHSRQIKSLIKSTLSGFFTKKEIKQILNGREFYLSGQEVQERVEAALESMHQEEEE